MDDLHAAIARAQLKKLPGIVERRQAFVRMMLDRGFAELPGISIPQKNLKPGFESCYWWWRLRFVPEALKCDRAEFCKALAAEGVLISENYYAARPACMEWFQNRAEMHPWNNPLYKGDPAQEYPTPNCDRTMSTDFIFFIYESYGEKEADMCMEAFRKVTGFYAR